MRDLYPQFNELIFNIFNIESTVLKLNSNHIAIAYALTEVWKSKVFLKEGHNKYFFSNLFLYI